MTGGGVRLGAISWVVTELLATSRIDRFFYRSVVFKEVSEG